MASVSVQVHLHDVLHETLDVTTTRSSAATDSVYLGTSFVTRIRIVTTDQMKKHAMNKAARKKHSSATMAPVCRDQLFAMVDGNVRMDLMKHVVTKASRVTRSLSDVNLDNVYLNTPSVTLSLIVLMALMKSMPFVNTVSMLLRFVSLVSFLLFPLLVFNCKCDVNLYQCE